MKPDLFDEILNAVQSALPPGLGAISQDCRGHLKLKLETLFEAQGLVTQQSFDTQRQVLLRTREKLEALEKRLADLESRS